MLKKTIKYTDYNGTERTEDFYFNLTKAEILEMEMSEAGGLTAKLHRIIESKDNRELMKHFKYIIHKAYGEKSDDGRRFVKSDEISTAFEQTEAYEELFMELFSDAEKAAEFVNGIIPQGIPTTNIVDKPNV
jgi:hypothetical protein